MYKVKPNTIILSVEEFYSDNKEGYIIKTNKGNILLVISNHQNCCEKWGYSIECKEPDLEYYKGAKLISVGDNPSMGPHEEDNSTCLNVKTSKGDIDLWVYNNHNGYYSHSYLIRVQDYEEEDRL